MNINNFFDFADKTSVCYNCITQIKDFEFYLSILSIDSNSRKYNLYSHEWLYLITSSFPNVGAYYFFADQYNNALKFN